MGRTLLAVGVVFLMGCPPEAPPRRAMPRRAKPRRAAKPAPRRAPEKPPRPLEPPATWKAYFTVMRGARAVGRAYLGFERNDEGSRYEVRQSVKTTWGRVTQHVNLQVSDKDELKWLRAVEMEQVAGTVLRIFARYDVKRVPNGIAITTTRFGHRWTQVLPAGGALPIARYPLLAAYFLARKQGRKKVVRLTGSSLDPATGKSYPLSFDGSVKDDRATFTVQEQGLGSLQLDYDVAWAKLFGVKGTGKLYGYRRGGRPPALVPPPPGFNKVKVVTPFVWPKDLRVSELRIPVRGGQTLRGLLSLPAKGRRFPLVILVPAADVTDWDGTRGMRRFYAELAATLSSAGYAVFRFAPRGVAPTGGDRSAITLATQLADLRAVVGKLRRHKRVKRNRVVLLGHAEGGVVALRYAATRAYELRGLILVSTPGVEYNAYILDQWRRRWETSGMSLKVVNQRIAWFKAQLQKVAGGARKDFLGRPGGLIRDLLKIDPLKAYKRVRLRTLILAGQADVTVRLDDVNALRAGMPRNRKITVARPDHVGHLLQHSPRFLELSEMWKIPSPISPDARKPLLDWLAKNAK